MSYILSLLKAFLKIAIELLYSVVLVSVCSGVSQLSRYILSQILFLCRLFCASDCSSLYSRCLLFPCFVYSVCVLIPNSTCAPVPAVSSDNRKFAFYVCFPFVFKRPAVFFSAGALIVISSLEEEGLPLSQFSSVAQSCPTLCDPVDRSTPCPYHQLLEFTQIRAHRVSDAIKLSHPLSFPSPSHLQSLPASGPFPMSQFFISGGQRIGVSASTSVLPMNIQD